MLRSILTKFHKLQVLADSRHNAHCTQKVHIMVEPRRETKLRFILDMRDMRDQARLCHGREFWNAFVKPLQVHPTAGYDMSTGHWAQFSKSAFPNAEHIEMETSKDFEEHVLSILQSFALKHRYQMVLQMVLNRPLSAEPEAFLAIVYLGLDIREPQNR